MTTIYLVCGVIGGTLLLCQSILSLIGMGGGHDVDAHSGDFHVEGAHDGHDGDHHGDSSIFAGLLTFRTVVSAVTFFGLAGMAATTGRVEPGASFGVALAAGAAAMFGVATLMRGLAKLRAEGTVRIERAVGSDGSVYLTIPAQRGGAGKVTLNIQNRTVEYQAVTAHGELPTGTKVVVVGVVGPGTVEVAPALETERV